MKFSFSGEQDEFRSNLRRLLADRSPTKEVRRLMETDQGYEREGWQAMSAVWAGAMTSMLRAMPRGSTPWSTPHTHERASRGTRPADTQGAASAAAAPDPRDAEIDRLARHIDALEQRLAEIERGGRDRRAPPRGRTRKRRPAE